MEQLSRLLEAEGSPRSVSDDGGDWDIVDLPARRSFTQSSGSSNNMSTGHQHSDSQRQSSEDRLLTEGGECLADEVLCQPLQTASSTGRVQDAPQDLVSSDMDLMEFLATVSDEAQHNNVPATCLDHPISGMAEAVGEADTPAGPVGAGDGWQQNGKKPAASLPMYAVEALANALRQVHRAVSGAVRYVYQQCRLGLQSANGAAAFLHHHSHPVLAELGSCYRQFMTLARKGGQPRWLMVGMSVTAAVALAGWLQSRHTVKCLRSQLVQRDRELTGLVVKILNLQDVMQSSRTAPLLCHTSLPRQRYYNGMVWL